MHINDNIAISPVTAGELIKLEKLLTDELSKGNAFISGEALRILKSGGKRLRPVITLLFSHFGNPVDIKLALKASAAIEIMHMATLVHDDTIDNAEQRRGIDTTFKKHGIHTAVYTGDWMLLRSLKMMSSDKENDQKLGLLLDSLSDGLEMVCNGEIDQYYGRGRIPSMSEYFSRIKGKTEAMFGAAAMIGARVADMADDHVRLAYDFGMDFGTAFQIRDDIIDMGTTGISAGKPVTNDLREGIITLPVLLACEKSKRFRKMVEDFLSAPAESSASEIIKEAIRAGGIGSAAQWCSTYVSKCVAHLSNMPESPAVKEIDDLVKSIFGLTLEG